MFGEGLNSTHSGHSASMNFAKKIVFINMREATLSNPDFEIPTIGGLLFRWGVLPIHRMLSGNTDNRARK